MPRDSQKNEIKRHDADFLFGEYDSSSGIQMCIMMQKNIDANIKIYYNVEVAQIENRTSEEQ